jgi:sporulation protein YlmC with PRC-barrel domain
MDLYMIRRRDGWKTGEELEAAAKRSTEVADADFPQDIAWIRSYVVAEKDGQLGTVCIYQASSEDAVRQHADRVGMPADEVLPIADTVIVRPDPKPAAAA